MTDQDNTENRDRMMDERLRGLFPPKPALAADFEQRVMSGIDSVATKSAHKRRLAMVMMVYWLLFGLISGWMIAGTGTSNPGASTTAIGALSLALVLVIASMLFLGRQSHSKISQLFLRTVV